MVEGRGLEGYTSLASCLRGQQDVQTPRRNQCSLARAINSWGTVVDVTKGQTTAHVRINVNGTRLIASMTNEAVDELKLTMARLCMQSSRRVTSWSGSTNCGARSHPSANALDPVYELHANKRDMKTLHSVTGRVSVRLRASAALPTVAQSGRQETFLAGVTSIVIGRSVGSGPVPGHRGADNRVTGKPAGSKHNGKCLILSAVEGDRGDQESPRPRSNRRRPECFVADTLHRVTFLIAAATRGTE
jgi:molybdopterin-binding protein